MQTIQPQTTKYTYKGIKRKQNVSMSNSSEMQLRKLYKLRSHNFPQSIRSMRLIENSQKKKIHHSFQTDILHKIKVEKLILKNFAATKQQAI